MARSGGEWLGAVAVECGREWMGVARTVELGMVEKAGTGWE